MGYWLKNKMYIFATILRGMEKLFKNINISIRIFLLLLVIGFYSSNTMFYHAHRVNGFVFSHSHPFKHDKNNKTPYESHSHSSSAYSFIQQLNEASWRNTAETIEITCPIIFYFESQCIYNSPFIKVSDYSFGQLRAPPTIC